MSELTVAKRFKAYSKDERVLIEILRLKMEIKNGIQAPLNEVMGTYDWSIMLEVIKREAMAGVLKLKKSFETNEKNLRIT